MHTAVIAATGLYTPPQAVSNAELVEAFNAYVERHNARHAEEIAAGAVEALAPSSPEFIVKASGIKSRYVVDKTGVLDPEVMAPRLAERGDEELSLLAEMAVHAARDALEAWGGDRQRIGAVLCAASNMQRRLSRHGHRGAAGAGAGAASPSTSTSPAPRPPSG